MTAQAIDPQDQEADHLQGRYRKPDQALRSDDCKVGLRKIIFQPPLVYSEIEAHNSARFSPAR